MWSPSRSDDALATIEAVYRERFAGFVRLAQAITGEEQAALDAVHDGFVRAVRYRRGLRDRESAAGWICRIVINEARRHARRAVPLELRRTVAEEHADMAEVRAAVAALPERQRLALFLRYYADLDYAGHRRGARHLARHRLRDVARRAHDLADAALEEVRR